MNKKKIEEAWGEFFAANQRTTIEEMNKDGWKTIKQVAEATGRSERTINKMAYSDGMEIAKKTIVSNGSSRLTIFMRPKCSLFC